MGEKDSSLLRKEKRYGLSRKSTLLKTCLEDIERFSKGEVQHFQKGNEITNRLFRPWQFRIRIKSIKCVTFTFLTVDPDLRGHCQHTDFELLVSGVEVVPVHHKTMSQTFLLSFVAEKWRFSFWYGKMGVLLEKHLLSNWAWKMNKLYIIWKIWAQGFRACF